MPLKTREELLRNLILNWVSSLQGRYGVHTSDVFLVGILHLECKTICQSKEIYEARRSVCYSAAIKIFENVLQHECKMEGGHNVAHQFSHYIEESLAIQF